MTFQKRKAKSEKRNQFHFAIVYQRVAVNNPTMSSLKAKSISIRMSVLLMQVAAKGPYIVILLQCQRFILPFWIATCQCQTNEASAVGGSSASIRHAS